MRYSGDPKDWDQYDSEGSGGPQVSQDTSGSGTSSSDDMDSEAMQESSSGSDSEEDWALQMPLMSIMPILQWHSSRASMGWKDGWPLWVICLYNRSTRHSRLTEYQLA